MHANSVTPSTRIIAALDKLAAGVKRARECEKVNVENIAKRCKLFVAAANFDGFADDTSTAPTSDAAPKKAAGAAAAPRKLEAAVEMVRIAAVIAQDDRHSHNSLVELEKMCILFVDTVRGYNRDATGASSRIGPLEAGDATDG